jgi:hypothetical protein
VATGEVLRTFKDVRTEHDTYTAEVRLMVVHKGKELVRKVSSGEGGGDVVPASTGTKKSPTSSSSSSSSSATPAEAAAEGAESKASSSSQPSSKSSKSSSAKSSSPSSSKSSSATSSLPSGVRNYDYNSEDSSFSSASRGFFNSAAAYYVTNNVYNVSNFGDKAMCYADVTAGETYLFFLTLYEGRLSAKYDDIFGAAADYNDENEKQVLDYLGE